MNIYDINLLTLSTDYIKQQYAYYNSITLGIRCYYGYGHVQSLKALYYNELIRRQIT